MKGPFENMGLNSNKFKPFVPLCWLDSPAYCKTFSKSILIDMASDIKFSVIP